MVDLFTAILLQGKITPMTQFTVNANMNIGIQVQVLITLQKFPKAIFGNFASLRSFWLRFVAKITKSYAWRNFFAGTDNLNMNPRVGSTA